ncbi:MAG: hypothetical protein QM778_18540 [Myxococcales bacterium]
MSTFENDDVPDRPSSVTIDPGESLAEVRVIDARFHVVERAVGRCTFALSPGVYKVRAILAGQSVESRFVVKGDGKDVTVGVPGVEFRSAVPLRGTSTSHEYHQAAVAAATQTQARDVGLGTGGTLLVSVRDPGSANFTQRGASKEIQGRYRRAFQSFSLQRATEETVVPLVSVARFDPDMGYLTCHLALEPGWYALIAELPGEAPVAIPVLVEAAHETQIFFEIQVDPKIEHASTVDLRDRALVITRPGMPFQADARDLRATEIARRAYSRRRTGLAENLLQEFLRFHLNAPMLGLLAAHLALHPPDQAPADEEDVGPRISVNPLLLREAVLRLTAQLGAEFPDVAALHAKLEPWSSPITVTRPPLLRSSWHILQHAGERVVIAPELRDLLSRTTTVGTWLAWKPARQLSETQQAAWTLARHAAIAIGNRWLTGAKARRDNDELATFVGGFLAQLSAGPTEEKQDPAQALLTLFRGIAESPWWDRGLAWIQEHGDSELAPHLTGLQATLLAAVQLAHQRIQANQPFELEDMQAMVASLQLSYEVLEHSLADLRDMLLAQAVSGGSQEPEPEPDAVTS